MHVCGVQNGTGDRASEQSRLLPKMLPNYLVIFYQVYEYYWYFGNTPFIAIDPQSVITPQPD